MSVTPTAARLAPRTSRMYVLPAFFNEFSKTPSHLHDVHNLNFSTQYPDRDGCFFYTACNERKRPRDVATKGGRKEVLKRKGDRRFDGANLRTHSILIAPGVLCSLNLYCNISTAFLRSPESPTLRHTLGCRAWQWKCRPY